MAETAQQLRERAAQIRQLAQYADRSANYHEEMQTAQHLEARADELEESSTQATGSRTGSVPDRSGTSPIPGGRTGTVPGNTGTSHIPGGRTGTASRDTENKAKLLRKKELAKIHLLKKQIGLDEDSYRDMLEQLTGKRSSGKMNRWERDKVIKHLKRSIPKDKYPGRPNNTDSNPQLQKIEAQLTAAKLPWSYAIGIAKRQCGKTKLEFCDTQELKAVINALRVRNEKNGVPAA